MKAQICCSALVVLLAVALVSCDQSPEVQKFNDECKSEIGLAENNPDIGDPKVKCFLACMMKKMGKMADGKVVVDKEIEYVMKHIPGADDAMKQKTTECITKANEMTDECEVAASMYTCGKENIGQPLD